MRIFPFLLLILSGILMLCCNDTPAKIEVVEKAIIPSDTIILLFQLEQKGEIWGSGKEPKVLETFEWQGNYPLGELLLFADTDFPLRKFQGKRCYVFPSKPTTDGRLAPCFGCRHDIAEKYATLELVIEELKIGLK